MLMFFTEKELYEFSQDELIDFIFSLYREINRLDEEISNIKQKNNDKINKDFEDNKKLVSNLLTNIVQQCDTTQK